MARAMRGACATGPRWRLRCRLGFGVVMVALFLTLPAQIIALFLDERKPDSAAIIAFGVTLLAMAALFQMADAMQVMALGLLRGDQGYPGADAGWPRSAIG